MNGMTVIFSMTASAYLTTALICAFIWCRQRDAWAHLLFALAALAAAAFVWCDFAQMHAESPAQFASALRSAHLAVWVITLSLAGFVRLYLHAGRTWLLWSVCGLRTFSLFLNLTTGQDLDYRRITGLSHITFLGDSVDIAKGMPNPWMLVGLLSSLGLVIFVVDAALAVWRRGDRRPAILVGGSIVFFVLLSSADVVLIVWGNVQWPLTPSLFFLGIIAAMGYEVSGEALRSVQLAPRLTDQGSAANSGRRRRGHGLLVSGFRTGGLLGLQSMACTFWFYKFRNVVYRRFLAAAAP